MTAEPAPQDIATDLVEYLVLVVPGVHGLAAVGRELARIIDSAAIRLLDLVVITLDAQDGPQLVEFGGIPELDAVRRAFGGELVLLSRHDIELVALALHPGDCAIVIVVEDRWATPLAAAVRGLGGEVRSGERIARERIEAALARVR